MSTSNTTLSRVAYCERLEFLDRATLLRIGSDGTGLAPTTAETTLGLTAGDIAAQALQLALDGYVSFVRTGRCTTNDTITLELVARGVTADAGFVRRIQVLGHSVDDAGVASFDRSYVIEGGSTPTVQTFGGSTFAAVQTTNGLATLDVDLERTQQASAEAQTLALAAGAGSLTITYTGQSGDVTNMQFEVRVFPKLALTFE
jgi:hypothetical protein